MSRTRLELFQWTALLAGPLAWAVQHVVMFFTVTADCNPAGSRWNVPQKEIVVAMTIATALVVVVAELAGYAAYRATDGIDKEGEPPLGRIRFLSMAALVIGPLFLALVLLDGGGNLAHGGCVQG